VLPFPKLTWDCLKPYSNKPFVGHVKLQWIPQIWNLISGDQTTIKQGLRQDSEAATTNNGTNWTRTASFPWSSVFTNWPSHRLIHLTSQRLTQPLIDSPYLSQTHQAPQRLTQPLKDPPNISMTNSTFFSESHKFSKSPPTSFKLTRPLTVSPNL